MIAIILNKKANNHFMSLNKLRLFEFNDTNAVPIFIRQSIVEILGTALREEKLYKNVGPIFVDFCKKIECDQILDLCSGSGEPVAILLDSLKDFNNELPQFILSDFYPNRVAFDSVISRYPKQIKAIYDSVDATNIPENLNFKAVTIISAFHHFGPEMAAKIIRDLVKKRKAIFLIEPLSGEFLSSIGSIIPMIKGFLKTNFTKYEYPAEKILFNYVIPISPLLGLWDLIVSILRAYSKSDYELLVRDFQDTYEWSYYSLPTDYPFSVSVFMGVPKTTLNKAIEEAKKAAL